MAFEPTIDMAEILERIEEEFEERDEAIERLTKRLDVQDTEIAKLRNEIAAALRPKPIQIARRGHDLDTAQVELR